MLQNSLLRSALVGLLFTLSACGGSSNDGSSASSSSSSSNGSSSAATSSTAVASTLVALSSANYTVPAATSSAVVTVNRVGASQGGATVSYSTVNGTATAGSDYASTSGTLTWADGDSSARTIVVPVSVKSANKQFGINLLSVAGAASFGSPVSATVNLASTGQSSSSSSSSSGSSSGSGSSTGSSAFSIAVSGNHLVNASGKVVQLRGANVSGLEGGVIFGGSNTPWSSAGLGARPDFSKLAAWKLNVVRLPLNEDSWLGLSVKGMPGNTITLNGSSYQAEVSASVAAANAAGLYVILDLHWSAPAGFAANVQNPMADATNSVNFWTSIANTFKSNPAVMFELFNEPYVDPSSASDGAFAQATGAIPDTAANNILRNGGTANYYFGMSSGTYGGSEQKVGYSWSTAGFQTLITAIRGTGATNVIICGGNHYSNDLSWWAQSPPSDPVSQLAAAIHLYSGGYPNNLAAGSASTDKMLAADVANYPVIVTEFGDEVGNAKATYTTQMTAWLDLHGYSVTAWTWNPWGGQNTLIQNDTSYTPTVGFGQTYHDWAVNHE